MHAVRTFRPYLHGRKFVIFTDHEALRVLNKPVDASDQTGQAARWTLILQGFDFEIRYIPGAKQLADVPSRFAQGGADDNSGAQLDHDASDERLHKVLAERCPEEGTESAAG